MARGSSPARKLGRRNDPGVLIMTSLASGAKHGYALARDIERFAGVTLGPGTLYGAITALPPFTEFVVFWVVMGLVGAFQHMTNRVTADE